MATPFPSRRSRAFRGLALLAALLLCAGSAQADRLLIRDARVFDGRTLLPGATDVLVEDGRIVRIGSGLRAGRGARVVEAGGQALLPGLIDLHTHWTPNTRPSALPEIANAYLDAGVTAVADFHQPPEAYAVRRQWLDGLAAPAVRFAARMSTPLGHGADWGDQTTTRWVNSPAAARAAVRAVAAARPDFIKAFTDGWRYNNAADNTSMDEATLAALVEEAHAHGLKVFTHTVTVARAKEAARAGVDMIAHSLLDAEVDDELIALMRAHGTAYGPSLAVYEPVRVGQAAPQDPETPVLRQRRANFANALANLKRLHDAGIPVAVATDAGMPGTPHGRATQHELALMVRAGLSPEQALRAATSEAARIMGLDGRGRIARGARADLLLVDGEPWRDPAAIREVRRVFVAGVEVTGPDAVRPAGNRDTRLPPRPLPALVDDFERADGRTALDTLRTTDADGGNDRSWQLSQRVPRADGGGHALATQAQLSHGQSPYATVILPLTRGSVAPATLAGHAGLSFQARGDAGSLQVEIRGQDGRRWAHRIDLDAQWRGHRVPWSAFAGLPPYRGDAPPPAWRVDDAVEIAFRAGGEPGDLVWFELDDVRFVESADDAP